MLAVEVLMLAVLVIGYEMYGDKQRLNIDDICLRVQAIIIIPSELMYAQPVSYIYKFEGEHLYKNLCCYGTGCLPCCCCYTPAILLTSLCNPSQNGPYTHPSARIGISTIE